MQTVTKEEIADWFKNLQDDICKALGKADGTGLFKEDLWQRPGGGGGRTRVMQNGTVIEKGGVNFSAVFGKTDKRMQEKMGFPEAEFFASGVSIVIHPHSPKVPIIHMNVRYFELSTGIFWFGGGIDLTPHYVVKEDAQFFHQQLKEVCDKFHPEYYPKFKKWADDYFFIPHRDETRGVGGIFFDRLKAEYGFSKKDRWQFVQTVGEKFAPIYTHLMQKNKDLPFTEQEKNWQLLRRGRYVEFNLVYDQGTKFGLETSGRIESILMSLPQYVSWQYNIQPKPNSQEGKTLKMLKKDINWI